MIVPMKKITVLVQSKDITETLHELAKAGVLHIEHQNEPVSRDLSEFEEKYSALSKAIEFLTPSKKEHKLHQGGAEKLVTKILSLIDEKDILIENLRKVTKDINIWKEWGDFYPGLIDDLKRKHIWVRLCKITKKEAANIPEGVLLKEVSRKGNVLYCAIISTRDIELAFEVLALPERSLGEMMNDEQEKEMRIKEIDKELDELSVNRASLISYKSKLVSLIEFNRAHAGSGRFERLSYIRGYSPLDTVSSLEKISKKQIWVLVVVYPSEEDNVPSLVKNPRFIEIIKPVFQMIKTIPGYKEVDVSMWFLLFFSIFFGMLIGDAGYGAIFFIINLFCHIKFRNKVKDKSIFFLTYILSAATIAWGVLSGTFFGQAYLPERVGPLLPYLRDNMNVQALCFFIGAAHLSIAHIWKFLRKFPSLKAFSEVGWIAILWGANFLARSLILGEVFASFGKWLFIGGAGLIILFTNPSKNILKSCGSGIGNFLLNIINSFTDVVSYIRLFAVGAATVAVADAFNQMALEVGQGSVVMGLVTALILFFGHTLNILLGAMAVLVHGVRLNVLEFSSHLDMEFSGVEYAPFKE